MSLNSSGKYISWIHGLIALVAIIASLGGSYLLTKYRVEQLEYRIDKTETNVEVLKIQQAVTGSQLTTIQTDISEIKRDVKTLLQGRRTPP